MSDDERAQAVVATVQPSHLQVPGTRRATVNVDVQLSFRDDNGEWKANIRPLHLAPWFYE